MKNLRKLLSAITALGLTTVSAVNVVACENNQPKPPSKKTDINEIIKTTDLGSIYVGQLNIPNKEQLLIAIKAKNPEAKDLTINDFTFKQGSPETTSATIVGKGQYQGEVSLTFTIKNFKSLSTAGIPKEYGILSLAIDKDGSIYAGSNNGNIFKCLAGKTTFKEMTGTSGWIYSLAIDKDDNIYAGSNNGTVYKCLAGKTTFQEMTGTNGEIYSLAVDKDGNVYAGSNNGTVYKSNGKDAFIAMTGTSGAIYSLAVDKSGNVYAGNNYGNIFKCLAGQTNFSDLFQLRIHILSLAIDKDDNIYAGSDDGTVYKLNGKDIFMVIGASGVIHSLIINQNGNIYAGSDNGTVYKSNGKDAFIAMTGTSGEIEGLAIDKDDNIYAVGWNNANSFYKSEKI